MEKIQLHSVLPQVFAQRNDLDSEIWKQDVTFEKGHLYLIEAESGSGKSTFCSYVLGYRHDYSGSVMFDKDVTANYKVKGLGGNEKASYQPPLSGTSSLPGAYRSGERRNQKQDYRIQNAVNRYLKWFDMLGIADKVDAKDWKNVVRTAAACGDDASALSAFRLHPGR